MIQLDERTIIAAELAAYPWLADLCSRWAREDTNKAEALLNLAAKLNTVLYQKYAARAADNYAALGLETEDQEDRKQTALTFWRTARDLYVLANQIRRAEDAQHHINELEWQIQK